MKRLNDFKVRKNGGMSLEDVMEEIRELRLMDKSIIEKRDNSL